MTEKTKQIRVLVGYGPLIDAGYAVEDIITIDAEFADRAVAARFAEYWPPKKAAPQKKAAPEKPEERPEPKAEVEER